MTPQEWAYLLEERIAIMRESGEAEPVARAKAMNDTITNYGHKPGVVA